jgi:hypothetical protein
MAQPTKTAKASKLFNIRTISNSNPNGTERVIAGTLKDYLVDSEELSLSDNVNYPVVDIKNDPFVTLKIVYSDSDESGLLFFSKALGAKLRNKAIKLADMLDYPIQLQELTNAQGEEFTMPLISLPAGGSRVKIKIPVAGAKSNKPEVSDMW